MRVMCAFTLGYQSEAEEIRDYISSVINDSFESLYKENYCETISRLVLRGIVRTKGEEDDFLLNNKSYYNKKSTVIGLAIHLVKEDYIELEIEDAIITAKKDFYNLVEIELDKIIEAYQLNFKRKLFLGNLHKTFFDLD